MIRDVFYFGKKPNVHPREKFAKDLADARSQCSTYHFWIINEFCDYRNFDWDFDFEFLPDEDVWAEEHNNVWPSQHQKDSGTWLCAKQHSDINIYRADVDPVYRKNEINQYWVITDTVDKNKVDFSWHPDPTDPPYIYKWGNKFYPVEIASALEYHVPDTTNIKYMNEVVQLEPEADKWKLFADVDTNKFDMSWRPDPREPAFIYVFGNQWNDATIEPTVEYHTTGATDKKYITDTIAYVSPNFDKWKQLISVDKFDFSWRPNPNDPPYIYVFGNQWHDAVSEPTLEYHAPGATDKKYITDIVAHTAPFIERWKQLISVDKFDFSWRPNPNDPPYIYVFGNQWHDVFLEPTLEYHAPGATDKKYITDIVAYTKPNMDYWITPNPIYDFDYSWRPHPHNPPMNYQFGTQWAKTHGPRYIMSSTTETKYIEHPVAVIKPDMTNWTIPAGIDVSNFDFSWHPDSTSPPMIYQFGTVLDDIHLKDGPIYKVPNNVGTIVYLENSVANSQKMSYPKYYIKTTLEDLTEEHPDEIFWALRENINYDNFDFAWSPIKENAYHINVFGSPDSEITQTYFVNAKMIKDGYNQLNFIENKTIDDAYLATLFKPVDMFFVDKSNKESTERFEKIKARFPNIQKTRYLNSWVDTINRCLNKCTTELCWILNSELDYTDFDFGFYPNPWQMKMVHVFGTQWNHWGTTFVVNKESFPTDTTYIKVIEHLPNINFIKKTHAKATNCMYQIYLIDYGNVETESVYELLRTKSGSDNVYKITHNKNYLNTFKQILDEIPIRKEHYIWVCSSVCDYSTFDFSYISDPFNRDQLHVFPSDKQKFGDTFFFDVNKLRNLIDDIRVLAEFDKMHYNANQRTRRIPCPIIVHDFDTHTGIVNEEFNFPYALLKTRDNQDIKIDLSEPPMLWGNQPMTILSEGATNIFLPKSAKRYISSELYDYPYIITSKKLSNSQPLDIVFLSNGETGADENYEHLLKVTNGLRNRVVRVDGVNGRVQAYHAAAEASNTLWMFTVFAKLKVNSKFDWTWQPDRLQVPKHYIFNATNPVNGLEYGHQAMIAYNKKITLANSGTGLDFTLDNEHEVVELNSGIAMYNTDEWSTWRTAFREVLKLRADDSQASKDRLEAWLNVGEGDYAQYSIQGAQHAVEYYESVNGELNKLRLSYDWPWLQEYFNTKYN